MGACARRMQGRRGFTLIELLVVLALMALLVAVAPPAFERLRVSAEYRNTLRLMLSDLRTARQLAVSEGRQVVFKVDMGAGMFGVNGAKMHPFPKQVQVKATVGATELTPQNMAGIRFFDHGGATGGMIDVLRPSGVGTRLRVDWLTGQVEQQPLAADNHP